MVSSPFPFSCMILALVFVSGVTSLHCGLRPTSLSDVSHSIMAADERVARVAALCHVVCINRLMRANPSENSTTNIFGSSGDPLIQGVFMFSECSDVRKYLDCRTGCIAASEGNCGTCTGRCQGLCGFSNCDLGFEGNRCGAQCDSDECNTGCQLFTSIPPDNLQKPLTPPVLDEMNDQALYSVEIPMELEMYHNPSVIFRIEHSPGEFVYHWMVDVTIVSVRDIIITDFLLDLSSLPGGSRLNASFAYVTEESGISPYSDPTLVQLAEGCFVRPLTADEVNVTSERDTRAGYFNHPVLNVTWCPTSCTERVSHYIVSRKNCQPLNVTANSTATNKILRSESPGSFFLPCQEQVEVHTVLTNGEIQSVSKSLRLTVHRSDFPELQLSCPATYSREEGKYIVDLSLTAPYSPATLSNIRRFNVRVDTFMKPGALIQSSVICKTIPSNVNTTVYGARLVLEPLIDASQFHQIRVQVLWAQIGGSVLPDISGGCVVDGTGAPPPLPIDSINVTGIDIQRLIMDRVKVIVRYEFERPEVQFSNETRLVYQVYFGVEPLGPTDETVETIVTSEQRGGVVQTFSSTLTAYLQIRTYQFDNFPSNWSDPLAIEIAGGHTTSTPDTSSTSSVDPNPTTSGINPTSSSDSTDPTSSSDSTDPTSSSGSPTNPNSTSGSDSTDPTSRSGGTSSAPDIAGIISLTIILITLCAGHLL